MSEWISVKDSPLPEDGFYLVRCETFNQSGYAVAEFDNNVFEWLYEGDGIIDIYVTHWMPLPEPPKE